MRRSLPSAARLRGGLTVLTTPRPPAATLRALGGAVRLPTRLSGGRSEALLPVVVVLVVVFASLLSWLPGKAAAPSGPVGGPAGNGSAPRLALGGTTGSGGTDGSGPSDAIPGDVAAAPAASARARSLLADPEVATLGGPGTDPATTVDRGPYALDGTLMKPIAVDTSVADGRALLKSYTVKTGDTLTGIANRFGVSMMTIWWANNLKSKTDFKVGQALTIPPVDGLVYTVREGDTLESLGTTYEVDPDTIYKMNGLQDRVLVVGQTLVLPGAVGTAVAKPPVAKPPVIPPTVAARPNVKPPTVAAGPVSPPTGGVGFTSGGSMLWPVVGGGNYISQYFHNGHNAVDIAAAYGSAVVAARSGTVTFAGWKNNGGGFQVWIAHGSGLFTTYNHMSAVTVGAGQAVGGGQQVGRIGTSGDATGPHLHFEVWRGPIWNGGTRVNPLVYF